MNFETKRRLTSIGYWVLTWVSLTTAIGVGIMFGKWLEWVLLIFLL